MSIRFAKCSKAVHGRAPLVLLFSVLMVRVALMSSVARTRTIRAAYQLCLIYATLVMANGLLEYLQYSPNA